MAGRALAHYRALDLVRETHGNETYEYYPVGEYVVVAPGVCGGRPTFKGTRIEVQVVLDWLRAGRSIERILEGYPTLTHAAVEEAIELASEALVEQYAQKAA